MSDADEAVEIILDKSGERRVILFRRPSGTYGYTEEKHFANEFAEGWAPLGGHPCFYDSLDTARREVVGNVSWLAER